MKSLLKYFLILIILWVSSCTDKSLDVVNYNTLTDENFYKTEADFVAAINTAYITFMERGMYALMMNFTVGTFDDRVLFETTGRDQFNTVSSSSQDQLDVWQALYHGVYRSSRIIQKLEEKGVAGIENMTQESYDNIAAQAKAIRGMSYFYLTIFFDRPILYDENSIPDNFELDLPNGKREDIWAQIEKDFSEAIPNLPLKSEQDKADWGRVTKGGVQAQLAKALLYKHYYYYERFEKGGTAEDIADLTKAKNLFKEVMSSNEYELMQPKSPKTKKDYLYALLCNSSFVDLVSENNTHMPQKTIKNLFGKYSFMMIRHLKTMNGSAGILAVEP